MSAERYASRSFGAKPYSCEHPWPEDCHIQCGDRGLVLVRGGKSYTTAFFEAFPRKPDTFIRREGKTVAEAEAKAWAALERYSECEHPAFERRKYKNGAGFCIECGMFKGGVFEPTTKCHICGEPTNWRHEGDVWTCKGCSTARGESEEV